MCVSNFLLKVAQLPQISLKLNLNGRDWLALDFLSNHLSGKTLGHAHFCAYARFCTCSGNLFHFRNSRSFYRSFCQVLCRFQISYLILMIEFYLDFTFVCKTCKAYKNGNLPKGHVSHSTRRDINIVDHLHSTVTILISPLGRPKNRKSKNFR